MNMNFLRNEGLGFVSSSTNQKYKTDLTNKLEEIPIVHLPVQMVLSFKDGMYKTYRTIDNVIL